MFIPRHPVVENQFCSYAAQTGTSTAGIGGVVAYAGSVVYLDSSATNQEAEVKKFADGDTAEVPFGFLMQKVKTGYHQVHPTGFYMPGDLGSSDVIAQPSFSAAGAITGTKSSPVGVAHLGIWDTVHYVALGTGGSDSAYTGYTPSAALTPGKALYPAADEAKLTDDSGDTSDGTDYNGEGCYNTTVVARVVKGASTAKITANAQNTTLYPIRVKLLV